MIRASIQELLKDTPSVKKLRGECPQIAELGDELSML